MIQNSLFNDDSLVKEAIDYKEKLITPNLEFKIWDTYKKPKIYDEEHFKSLSKDFQNTYKYFIERQTIIELMKSNNLDSVIAKHSETGELFKIPLETIENTNNHILSNLEIRMQDKNYPKEAEEAELVKSMVLAYDYNLATNYQTRNTFFNAMMATASQISLENDLDSANPKWREIVCNENKENLNYFGRKILEHREKPQTKEQFITDLINHSKTDITPNEVIILAKMYNLPKPPSLLNAEHKQVIQTSLKNAIARDKIINAIDEDNLKEINAIVEPKEKTKSKTTSQTKQKDKSNENSR